MRLNRMCFSIRSSIRSYFDHEIRKI
jgi:hypothetical protein